MLFRSLLEQENEKSRFVRVDSEVIDKLIEKEDAIPSKLSQEEQDKLKPIIEKQVDSARFHVQMESLSETDQPVIIIQNEFMRRYKDMAAMGGGGPMSFYGDMPESYNLVVNTNHPLVIDILAKEEPETLTKQLIDLALLSNGLLKGEALTSFVKRSVEMIKLV